MRVTYAGNVAESSSDEGRGGKGADSEDHGGAPNGADRGASEIEPSQIDVQESINHRGEVVFIKKKKSTNHISWESSPGKTRNGSKRCCRPKPEI